MAILYQVPKNNDSGCSPLQVALITPVIKGISTTSRAVAATFTVDLSSPITLLKQELPPFTEVAFVGYVTILEGFHTFLFTIQWNEIDNLTGTVVRVWSETSSGSFTILRETAVTCLVSPLQGIAPLTVTVSGNFITVSDGLPLANYEVIIYQVNKGSGDAKTISIITDGNGQYTANIVITESGAFGITAVGVGDGVSCGSMSQEVIVNVSSITPTSTFDWRIIAGIIGIGFVFIAWKQKWIR